MALGQRPLRTKQLTARIQEFSPRSIYRCIDKLKDYRLVERVSDPGPPARTVLRLTEPAGRNLFRLVRLLTSQSKASGEGLSWESLCLLGEMWELNYVEELSRAPRSLLELLDTVDGLSYHQVRRRTSQFLEEGLLETCPHDGNGNLRDYALSPKSRRCIAAVAAIGRWRHRYFLADGTPGLSIEELTTVLRTALPLVPLPTHEGKRLGLYVTGAEDKYGNRETGIVHGTVGGDGIVHLTEGNDLEPDGAAAATINTWFAALLDGNRGRIRVRGDLGLVDACLTQLYDALWVSPRR